MGEAKEAFEQQPKGEITLLIEGKGRCNVEPPSLSELENELKDLISEGHSLSVVKLRFYFIFIFLFCDVYIPYLVYAYNQKCEKILDYDFFFCFSLLLVYIYYTSAVMEI